MDQIRDEELSKGLTGTMMDLSKCPGGLALPSPLRGEAPWLCLPRLRESSVSSGGQCDLTNSNSSFGNIGLKADGFGDIEFTGVTTGGATEAQVDTIVSIDTKDNSGSISTKEARNLLKKLLRMRSSNSLKRTILQSDIRMILMRSWMCLNTEMRQTIKINFPI